MSLLLLFGGGVPAIPPDPVAPDTVPSVYLYDPTTATTYNISHEVYSVEIGRGRSRELDEINAGTCVVRARNHTGNFNPYFLSEADYLLLETGDFLLLENSGKVILESNGGGSAGSFGSMFPGRYITVKDGTTLVFSGFVEDFNFEWQPGGFTDVTLACADGLARLARQAFSEQTTTAGQTAGPRLVSVLSSVDLNWVTVNDYDTGLSVLQGDTITAGMNVLTYCQLVNKSEQGRFFVTRDNTLRLQDRQSVAAGTAVVNFSDTTSGVVAGQFPFTGIEVTFGSELLYNSVTVTNIDGTPQLALDTSDIANYGVRQLTLSGLLMDSDGQAADLASYLLTRYARPEAVASDIRVALGNLSAANRATLAAIELGDTVTLNWTPTASLGSVSQTLVVEGIGYSRSTDSTTEMSFQLSAAATNPFFILDTSRLDTDELGF